MTLTERVNRARRHLSERQPVDPDSLIQLAADIHREAAAMPVAEGQRLSAALAHLERAMAKHQSDTLALLRDAQHGKRALKGYGHLKSAQTCQKLATSA